MKYLIFVLLVILNLGCKESKTETKNLLDTKVGSRSIDDEISGSAYLKRASEYFTIINNDTSSFKPTFTESKEGGEVGLQLNLSYSRKNLSHNQRMKNLKQILSKASTEFNLDSLKGISIGRLIQNGDLAVKVSIKYIETFGNPERITTKDYNHISEFLLSTALKTDFDELFKPYHLSVESIGIEKTFFTDNRQLFVFSELESDSLDIPAKILDCITWISLKRINN